LNAPWLLTEFCFYWRVRATREDLLEEAVMEHETY